MNRNSLAIGGAALLVVVVLGAVWATRAESPGAVAPSASAFATASVSARPSGPSTAPTASPAGVAGLDDRFGFIVTSGSSMWLRPETDPQKRTTVTGRSFAVSPDGAQVALWRDSGGADELFLLPAAHPDQERSVYKVAAGQQGVQIIWANDASGLLLNTQRASAGSPGGPTVLMSTLVTLDLRTAVAATLGTLTDGRMYLPIAWDRSANLAVAGESSVTSTSPRAPVMETYLTIKTGGTAEVIRRTVTDGFGISGILASPDAKYVYARSADSIRFWPLADYGGGASFQATGLTGRLLWRPGTSQVAWLVGQQLNAYDVSTRSAVTLFRGITQNPTTGTDLQIFRIDGTAAVVGPVTLGPGAVAPMVLVLLGSGTAAEFDTAGAIGSGFLASVRLR